MGSDTILSVKPHDGSLRVERHPRFHNTVDEVNELVLQAPITALGAMPPCFNRSPKAFSTWLSHVFETLQPIHQRAQLAYFWRRRNPWLRPHQLPDSNLQTGIDCVRLVPYQLALREALGPHGIHDTHVPPRITQRDGKHLATGARRLHA